LTNFFTTLPYRITGDSYAKLSTYDTNSRKKIVQLGYIALLPSIIWFIVIFLTCYKISNASFWVSLMAAAVGFGIILILERVIVMAKVVSGWGAFVRGSLALLFAFMGSSMIDLLSYQEDINYKIKSDMISRLEANLKNKEDAVNNKSAELHGEMFGKRGTGLRGYANASKSIDNQRNDLIKQRDKASVELDSVRKMLAEPSSTAYTSMANILGMNTIVYRHEKLFEILNSNKIEYLYYVSMLLIGFFIEILPLIAKKNMKPSQYELDEEANELVRANMRKMILDKSNHYAGMSATQLMANDALNYRERFSIIN
jgi:hypothetical protein